MQRWIPFVVGALLLVGGVWWSRQATADVVRIHVVANSDDPADQQVKYAVRDALLLELGGGWNSAQDCLADLSARTGELEAVVNAVLSGQDMAYTGRVETGVYDFPTRVYGEEAWPAGRYRTLKVTLGEGAGQNWWCVLYPELCLQPVRLTGEADAVTGADPKAKAVCLPQSTKRPAVTAAPKADVEVRSWVWDHWVPQPWKQAWYGSRLGGSMDSYFYP